MFFLLIGLLALPILGVQQVAPNVVGQLQETLQAQTNFKLRLHAPQEAADDVMSALDALLKIGEAVHATDEDEFNNELQRLIAIYKNRIRDVLQAGFLPLIAMVPDPVRSTAMQAASGSLAGFTY